MCRVLRGAHCRCLYCCTAVLRAVRTMWHSLLLRCLQVTVPPNRMTPLKAAWLQIYTPVTETLKLDMRMNLKTRKVCGRVAFRGRRCRVWAPVTNDAHARLWRKHAAGVLVCLCVAGGLVECVVAHCCVLWLTPRSAHDCVHVLTTHQGSAARWLFPRVTHGCCVHLCMCVYVCAGGD